MTKKVDFDSLYTLQKVDFDSPRVCKQKTENDEKRLSVLKEALIPFMQSNYLAKNRAPSDVHLQYVLERK